VSQDQPDPARDAVLAWVRSNAALPREGLIEAIKKTQDQLLAAVGGASEDDARKRPSADEWSVNDLLRHVIDAEERVTRQIAALAQGRPDDLYNVAEGEAMQLPDEGLSFTALLARLKSANSQILDLLVALPADADFALAVAHGYFGPLNALEWAGFQVFHDTDHTNYARALMS
jgi:hypothetical protein